MRVFCFRKDHFKKSCLDLTVIDHHFGMVKYDDYMYDYMYDYIWWKFAAAFCGSIGHDLSHGC